MRASSSWSRSALALAMLGGVIGTAAPFDIGSDADAALVCQHKRKPLARLRVNACKKNEVAVFDMSAAANTFGLACAQDPARRLLTVSRDVAGMMSLGYIAGPLCRMLDDDLAGCAQAYEVGVYGTTACAAIRGKCVPCYPPLEAEGLCRNACQPPIGCLADPTRTDGSSDCGSATTPAACAQSWTTTTEYATTTDVIRATSCFWDTSVVPAACVKCDPTATSHGKCANTCIGAADLPRCRLGGRSYGDCSALDGNLAACGLTYEMSPFGTQTCWYDSVAARCHGCDPLDESLGRCTNGC